MSDHPNLKRHAALFFAMYAASRGLFAAADATHGIGCGCLSGLLSVVSWAVFATSLAGLGAVGSIALMKARNLECAVGPSILMLIPLALIFIASAPWTFGATERGLLHPLVEFGVYAPYASILTAIMCFVSHRRQRRLAGLPAARVIK